MLIQTNNADFVPINFVIYNFYGKDTCFMWKDNELIVFPYLETECSNENSPLNVLIAPGIIKSIQSFDERVFVICTPCGIFKLTEEQKFALLSRSGIGIGSLYSEVFSLQGRCIVLEGKHDKSFKKLFQVPSETVTSDELCSLKLNSTNTDEELRAIFLEDSKEDNLCLISYNKVLYKQSKNSVHIVYSCDYSINEILPIESKEKIVGAAIVTNSSAIILMYLQDKKLKFDKIYLNYDGKKVNAFCVKMDESYENCISIVYSDEYKTYQCRKKFKFNSLQKISVEECAYTALRFYKSNLVVGLTKYKELRQFRLKEVIEESRDDPEFIELKLHMLEGAEVIMEKILEKAKEHEALNKKLEQERDILRRINLYAYDYRVEYCPELRVEKVADEKYLLAKFNQLLPVNSQVILAAKRGDRRTFFVKTVTDSETQIELPFPTQNTSKPVDVTVDLITYNPKGESFCLITDFIQDPNTNNEEPKNLSAEILNFVNLKIRSLKNLIKDGKVTMKALSEIKSSIRRELRNLQSE